MAYNCYYVYDIVSKKHCKKTKICDHVEIITITLNYKINA